MTTRFSRFREHLGRIRERFGRLRDRLGDTIFFVLCFAVGVGAGTLLPDCSADREMVAERLFDVRHELVAVDEAHPDIFFTYTIRYLEDGWTAEDVGFTWRLADGTLVADSMSADRVAFSLHDHYSVPKVEMILRREMAPGICDDDSRSPQTLTHICTAAVIIHCTPAQLHRALVAAAVPGVGGRTPPG